ncbi:hypothetical protein Tco_0829216, partial [Tanacetum coccineum]
NAPGHYSAATQFGGVIVNMVTGQSADQEINVTGETGTSGAKKQMMQSLLKWTFFRINSTKCLGSRQWSHRSYLHCPTPYVSLTNGHSVTVTTVGSVRIKPNLVLHNVLYILSFVYNLLSEPINSTSTNTTPSSPPSNPPSSPPTTPENTTPNNDTTQSTTAESTTAPENHQYNIADSTHATPSTQPANTSPSLSTSPPNIPPPPSPPPLRKSQRTKTVPTKLKDFHH